MQNKLSKTNKLLVKMADVSAVADVVLLSADKTLFTRAVTQVLVLRVDLLPLDRRYADGEGGVTGVF